MFFRRLFFRAVVGVVLLIVAMLQSGGIEEVATEAVKLHLTMIGSSIYEYHAKTGKWPTRNADLGTTSLALKSPHWQEMLDGGSMVVVWRKDLQPRPRDNVQVILVYHAKGTLAENGRNWLCRGDLTTEYLESEKLQAQLKQLGKK